MRDTLFIIALGLLVYFGFANILGQSGILGSFGKAFYDYNHLYFGYIAYVYIFGLIYPLYKLYRTGRPNLRTFEVTVASLLLFFSFLLAQALLVKGAQHGKFAHDFVLFLEPYVGVFGLWVFWFIIMAVSVIILLDRSTEELLEIFKEFLKNKKKQQEEKALEKANTTDRLDDEELDLDAILQEDDSIYDDLVEKLPWEEETKKEDIEDGIEEIVDIPRIERKDQEFKEDTKEELKEQKEEKNILSLASKIKEQKSAVIVDELEENKKLLADIEKGKSEKPKNFKLPSLDFLAKPSKKKLTIDESEIDDKIKQLIEKLAHFKIEGDVVRTYTGPIVSTFEFKPAANVKVSKILNLQDDLAMALSAETIRIQAPIPGKDVVGIEIPNETRETIYLREILESKLFQEAASPLTMALGKDIVGKPFVTDLKKLPHLLIAGTTGSGKSVGINAMILSLLYRNSPDNLRLLMIDPKMLEFSIYNDIPHLLTPVITKPKQAVVALNNMVAEMERRYALMSDTRTKNIENYNEKAKKNGVESLPYIVVIIDELSDLMMTSGKDVEHSIARLAQMARASGIHLIVATQRPSVDVVTGLIKANLPSRISYRVGQKIDSKIILDQQGAESLLGRGDMLFTPPGATGLVRLHAPWSSEEEIEKIVEFLKSQREPNYDKSFLVEENEEGTGGDREVFEELDPLFEEAKSVVLTDKKTSISYLQRKLQIGYNRAARVIEQLEQEGILSAPNAKGVREILV